MDKGQVYPYVEQAYKLLQSKGSFLAVKEWHRSRRKELMESKDQFKSDRKQWLKKIKDEKVLGVVRQLNVPFIIKLMRDAGMKEATIHFLQKVFTEGAEYITEVDITGLYERVPKENQYGNYEFQAPVVLQKSYDVNTTLISDRQGRVPDKYTDKIYQYTKQGWTLVQRVHFRIKL